MESTNDQHQRPQAKSTKPILGITAGDINGIGLEVILKALAHQKILDICVPVIYGSSKVVSYHKNIVQLDDVTFIGQRNADRLQYDKINVVNIWNDNVNITLGKPTDIGGTYAQQSLEAAVKDLKLGLIDAIVTAPIHKKSMQLAGFEHVGHTEYLTKEFEVADSLMLLAADRLRVGLVTAHVPLKDVSQSITKEQIISKLRIFSETLRIDFGYERPNIAVLGLNPHAGEEGMMGDEEEKVIRPAIVECKKNGMMAFGPFPADGFFGSGQFNKFDGILAMYHDQGLIPFKALTFGNGVNFTAGLPIVRTSPDHGTAFDLAGKNEADPSSFLHAMFMAIDIYRNRKEYEELKRNAVRKVEFEMEKEEGDSN
ncbi:MAG: 4-hydroxythreonine-4-phosphate dehydrogenase PdxA [Saprospiraceae bacterium]|nr:4-hydroxythreonine-4-phosphate dehydrogenase PdxA [Saprospiraceae bacterium]MCF8249421.1 4-hydroxythreonine-4-phosphate dehydrogenase PdxA [Saprospiraceae bacterium]MCF8279075.1 4-hydroxythreonine-4-phosphate dehydrogenase PdxA [Bacteroidales bacterium]MCF8311550.1 4-hydroxythreonine-4-phosphate dehydrogenase PdxA [Saprospiraceae bacterium]MCF8440040.1 4-hydroxythreonine-4-phosphate dehydrogenase PdxA [Saprospiraceae bacterium]